MTKVYVAVWSHRHGEDINVFHTKEGVEKWRQIIANDEWTAEIDEPKPEGREATADRYFEIMGERFSKGEYFDWTLHEIRE